MESIVIIGLLTASSLIYAQDCGLPAVPAHASVQFDVFPVLPKSIATYECEPGFILIGKDSRICSINGTWSGFPPLCVVDIALGKPAKSSSQKGRIGPSIAVNGDTFGTVSQDDCHSTQTEIAPWWSVNLLESYVVHSVRLIMGQSCCADGPVYIEVRVGNDRDMSRNALCGRYNGIIEEGAELDVRCYRPMRGIFLSVHQTRDVPNVLSLCKVQAFSDQAITTLQCPISDEKVDMGDVFTYSDQCYHFFNMKPDTWDNSQMYCMRKGGSLVWGTSPAFQAFVSWAMAHRYNRFSAENPNYWMGAMRSTFTDGEWMWVKGNSTVNPIRAFWSSRDPPGDFDGSTSCVMFDANAGWLWRATECTRNLNWVCEFGPRTCGNPGVSANSSVQYSSTDVGSVAVYGCTGGLYLRGQGLRRCQPNGKWSDQPPVCTDDGCGPPPTVENADVTFNSTKLGAVAQYTCTVLFKPIGNTQMDCTSEGSWSIEPPQCIPVDCGPAPGIPHGKAVLVDRQTSQGSVLKYKCHSGYRLVGDNHLVCDVSETWQGAFPFCQPDDGSAEEILLSVQPQSSAESTTTIPTTKRTTPTSTSSTSATSSKPHSKRSRHFTTTSPSTTTILTEPTATTSDTTTSTSPTTTTPTTTTTEPTTSTTSTTDTTSTTTETTTTTTSTTPSTTTETTTTTPSTTTTTETTTTTTTPTTTTTTPSTTTTSTTPTTTTTTTSPTTTSTSTATSTTTPTTPQTTTAPTTPETTVPTTEAPTTVLVVEENTTLAAAWLSTAAGFIPFVWQSGREPADFLNQEALDNQNNAVLRIAESPQTMAKSWNQTDFSHFNIPEWPQTSTVLPLPTTVPNEAHTSEWTSTSSSTLLVPVVTVIVDVPVVFSMDQQNTTISPMAAVETIFAKSPLAATMDLQQPPNGTFPSNISEGLLLDTPSNPFLIFTPPSVQTFSRQPVHHGRFSANNAMLHSNAGNSWDTDTTENSKALNTTKASSVLSFNVAVERPVDTVKTVEEHDLYNDVLRDSNRGVNRTFLLSSTEIIMPKVLESRSMGGWIALGIILGLLLLLLLIILAVCLRRRKRRQEASTVQVTSTHITSAAQYDTDQESGANAFSSRYRKAWDNLQFQVEDAGAAGGKDTPISQTTFKSTGPRLREENPVKAGTEIIVSPSRAGTVKSMGSAGGISEALNESDEVLVDQEMAPMQQRTLATPDGSAGNLTLPRPHLIV